MAINDPLAPVVMPYTVIAQSVHASLEDAFRAIPEGKRGALLATADANGGVLEGSFMVAGKISDTWELAGGVNLKSHQKPTAQIALMGSW